jgi:hypothetical protein
MFFLQEAIAAGPFLLVALLVGLVSILSALFLIAKVIKLRAEIKRLKNGSNERQLKEKRTQYFFFLSIIVFLTVAVIVMIVEFSNITFG